MICTSRALCVVDIAGDQRYTAGRVLGYEQGAIYGCDARFVVWNMSICKDSENEVDVWQDFERQVRPITCDNKELKMGNWASEYRLYVITDTVVRGRIAVDNRFN